MAIIPGKIFQFIIEIARAFPAQVAHIIIREVYSCKRDKEILQRIRTWFDKHDIALSYGKQFDEVLL